MSRTYSAKPTIGLQWLVAGRLGLLSVALAIVTFSTFLGNGSPSGLGSRPFYTAFAVLFAISAVGAIWVNANRVGARFTYLHILVDLLVVSGVVYITGGPQSPFVFLYLPVVIAAAILISRAAAISISIVTGLLYSILVLSMYTELFHGLLGGEVPTIPGWSLATNVIGLWVSLISTGFITSALVSRLVSSQRMVEQSARTIFNLSNRQQALIDGIPEGVLIAGADGKIQKVNSELQKMLQFADQSLVVGHTVEDVLALWEQRLDVERELTRSVIEPSELVVELKNGSTERMTHQIQKLSSENENLTVHVFQDVSKLRSMEEQLAIQERMARLLVDTDLDPLQSAAIPHLVGETRVMKKVYSLIERVSPSDATVLVHGESGTGKELVARAIHELGPRADGPFVAVNCGAIPETLIESELFGHKRGSFTGADTDKTGLFQEATGGTLFLDEIGELPVLVQSKLLRVLQDKNVRPVGANVHIPIDVRIIAATNRDLIAEVKRNNFREDLFYRLNVIGIPLPPLRDRKQDIPLLLQSLLRKIIGGGELPTVTPLAMKLLMDYNYPGNVRELENILERAHVLGEGAILPEHLPPSVQEFQLTHTSTSETMILIDESIDFPVDLDRILSTLERKYLEEALQMTQGAKKRAAELLGINFRSLRYRLQKFGISAED